MINNRVAIAVVAAIIFVIVFFLGYQLGVTNTTQPDGGPVEVDTTDVKTTQDTIVIVPDTVTSNVVKDETEGVANATAALPKPGKHTYDCNYPFDPAGCPFLFVKGSEMSSEGKSITVRLYGRDYKILIDNHQGIIRARISTDGYVYDLFGPVEVSKDDGEFLFDEWGGLLDEAGLQVTVMDFNNDNECELLFTIQLTCAELRTYIFKILPHPYKFDMVKCVGCILGQTRMYVDDTHIIVPIGGQGLFYEYILTKDDRLVDIGSFS